MNSDGNLTIWKVKAQAEIEHPSDMMTARYDTRDWVKATVPGTVFGSYVFSKNKAVLSLQLELRNHTDIEQKGVLKGIIQPGNIEFTED